MRSRIVFLEDYDITMARYLVSGSDIWLNTPRRPLEASGTSGMKAGMNGSLNVSILDGWWDEAYCPECGWAIGKGEEYSDPELQDSVEGRALFGLLEDEIIPLFYTRGLDGLPREWIKRMKVSMKLVGQTFSSQRMLMDYTNMFYTPALANAENLRRDNYAGAKSPAAYMKRVSDKWPEVSLEFRTTTGELIMKAGDTLPVSVNAGLAGLKPEEVVVELYYGPLTAQDEIARATRVEMTPGQADGSGAYTFSTELVCEQTGRLGYAARVLPKHPKLKGWRRPGLIKWA